MISTAYIHGYAPHDQFLYESHFYVLDIEDAENALISLETKLEEKDFFGESTDEYLLFVESEKKNIFTSIGEAIINLFKTFFDFLKETGKTIKDNLSRTRKKLSDDKTIEMMKQNPELAQEFLQSVMNGDIKARDVKDLNKMVDEAMDITEKLANGQYDKPTFDTKMEKLGNWINKCTKPAAEILAVSVAFTNLINGVKKMFEKSKDHTFDNEIGDYITESVSPIDAVKKVLDFFAERVTFCEDATKKLKELESILQDKLKSAKTSEDASVVKTAMEGIRKVMAVITKELTTAKNLSNKALKKISGGDK